MVSPSDVSMAGLLGVVRWYQMGCGDGVIMSAGGELCWGQKAPHVLGCVRAHTDLTWHPDIQWYIVNTGRHSLLLSPGYSYCSGRNLGSWGWHSLQTASSELWQQRPHDRSKSKENFLIDKEWLQKVGSFFHSLFVAMSWVMTQSSSSFKVVLLGEGKKACVLFLFYIFCI